MNKEALLQKIAAMKTGAATTPPETAPQAQAAPTPAVKPAADTTPPTFDNLADITAAAKAGETISLLNLYEIVNAPKQAAPTPAADPIQAAPDNRPELSTLTFADLMPQATAPTPAKAPQTAPQAAPTPAATATAGTIEKAIYSPKSFVVRGPGTQAIKDRLQAAGGTWNNWLKGGAGWIFSNKREATVTAILNNL